MEKISTTIITYNEEPNIERCIRSVIPFSDEIVVVDSFSTDNTVPIAKKIATLVVQHEFLGHVQQKSWAVSRAAHKWIFSIDADESVSEELLGNIISLKERGFGADAYRVNRRNFYLCGWFKAGGWYPDSKIRLFNREAGTWHGENPHDFVKMREKARVETCAGDLLHCPYRDLSHHLELIQKYSSISAEEKSRSGVNRIAPRLFFNALFKFFKTYVLQGAIFSGTRGYIFSVMASFSVFMKYAKLWEISNDKKTVGHSR